MRLHHLIRRARIVTIAAMFAAIPMSVFAQNGQSPFSISLQQASAQAAAQLQTESVRRLSIDEAVDAGARAEPRHPHSAVRPADFRIRASLRHDRSGRRASRPTSPRTRRRSSRRAPSPEARRASSTSNMNTAVGLNQTLPWGGVYSATWNSSRFTTTNLFQRLQSADRLEPEPAVLAAADAQFRDRSDPAAGRQQQEGARAVRHPVERRHHRNAASGQECVLGFVLCDRRT